jgi:hypothetical protein
VHYLVPLIDENGVFIELKTGRYISCRPPGSGKPYPCGPNAWDSQIWNERAFAWRGGNLAKQWNFQSDWKPEPNGGGYAGLIGWEPVFHAALNDGFVFVPGFAPPLTAVGVPFETVPEFEWLCADRRRSVR